VILARLKERPLRYGELRQLIPALSDKVLTQRLRDLEAQGLITRARAADARETAYWLTLMGETLRPVRMPFTPGKSDNQLTLALASLRRRTAPIRTLHFTATATRSVYPRED
jgi:DNA-binding HxlR family transcriptional regulator